MQDPEIANAQPIPMEGEYFVLARSGISFSAKSGSTKFEASGTLYLSTLRMVVVCDDARHAGFHGFDMPLATLYDESFNQPIFWANNLTGVSPPLEGSSFSADIKWTIYFNNGGVGTFLPFFFRLLQEMRERLAQPAHAPSALNVATMLVQARAARGEPHDRLPPGSAPRRTGGRAKLGAAAQRRDAAVAQQ